jgi:hypothetical protein
VTSAQPAADTARRAALLLHAMAPADQAWLLAALPAWQQARLTALLAELRALGIPADSRLLGELAQASPSAPSTPAQRMAQLEPAQVAQLAQVLAVEPPQLAARLLAGGPWPWRDAVAAAWSAEFRARVADAMPQRAAPAAERALCGLLLGQLASLPPSGPASMASPWRGWRRPHLSGAARA